MDCFHDVVAWLNDIMFVWLVARTVLWASLMPQLVLITELSFLTFD